MLYARIAAGVILLAVLAYAGHVVNGWRTDAAALPGARQALSDARQQLDAAATRNAELRLASEGYQNALDHLRADRDAHPVGPVRLCHRADVPAAAAGGAVAGGPDAAPAAPGALPPAAAGGAGEGAGPDIGPDLAAAADEADELLERLRAVLTLAPKPKG